MKFSTEDEEKLYKSLTKINRKIGLVFYSALVVLRQKASSQIQISDNPLSEPIFKSKINSVHSLEDGVETNHDRIAQSAHSMRETLLLILRFTGISRDSKKNEGDDEVLKNNIQKLIDQYAYVPNKNLNFRQYLAERIYKLYNEFVKISHHPDMKEISESEYLDKLTEQIKMLNYIFEPYYKIINKMNKLLENSNPTKENFEEIKLLMEKNMQTYIYFFKNAQSDWLEILVENKYFEKIPIMIEKDYTNFYAEFDYLERIVSEKPKIVKDIILNIPTPKNELDKNRYALQIFIRIATKMEPNIAKLIAERGIKKWYNKHTSPSLLNESRNLMNHLMDQEFETALKIYSNLIDLSIDTEEFEKMNYVKPYVQHIIPNINNRHTYKNILEEYIPILCEKNHDLVIEILIKKLRKANTLRKKIEQNHIDSHSDDSHSDDSHYWRPAIEEHKQNSHPDLRSDLVTSIRKALEKSESMGINSLKKSLNMLKDKDCIFRRLELYFFAKHPLEFSEEINKLSIEYFGNNNLKHEYYHMLKNNWPYLKAETQKKILKIISNGPDSERFNGNQDYWKMEKLSPIIEYVPEFQKEYNSLVEKYGETPLVEFSCYYEPVHIEHPPPSALNPNMSVSEVIEFIKAYKMPEGIFLQEDSTGKKFKELVEKNPEEYSKRAMELQHCHELFQYRFLEGLSKNNKILDWNIILNLYEYIIIDVPSKDSGIFDSILIYFGHMLKNNLKYNKNLIPFKLRDRIWKVLKKAIECVSDYETELKIYSTGSQDAMFIADNSSMGILVQALIEYAIWCDHKMKNHVRTSELISEVKILLESKLDPKQQQSISLHTILGYYFPDLLLLDKEWTKSNIEWIFNHNNHINAGNAAWDGYTLRATYRESFDVLFDEYKYRVLHITHKTIFPIESVSERLSKTIALIYLNDLNRSDELFILLLKNINATLMNELLQYFYVIIENWDYEKPPKIDIDKLLLHNNIKSNHNIGWLFLTSIVPKSEYMKLLNSVLSETKGKISPIYDIIKKIDTFVEHSPIEVLDSIEKIIKHEQIHESMYMILDDIDKIFSKIVLTQNKYAIEKMEKVINILGSLGYDQFQRFLK